MTKPSKEEKQAAKEAALTDLAGTEHYMLVCMSEDGDNATLHSYGSKAQLLDMVMTYVTANGLVWDLETALQSHQLMSKFGKQ